MKNIPIKKTKEAPETDQPEGKKTTETTSIKKETETNKFFKKLTSFSKWKELLKRLSIK